MKQFLFIISTTLLLGSVQAQDRKGGTYKRWTYGLDVAGTLNYRILQTSPLESALGNQRKNQEIARLSQAFGITAGYFINERLSLRTGLEYADLGYKTRKATLQWVDETTVSEYTAYHFRYVALPIGLNYYLLGGRRYRFFIGAGISPAVFIGETTKFYYGSRENTDSQPVGYDRFNFIADARAGIDYKISDRLQLTGGLFFKQFLNATNSNLPTKSFLNSSGVTIGISYYRIKK